MGESNSYMTIKCKYTHTDGKIILSDKWLHINEETGQTKIMAVTSWKNRSVQNKMQVAIRSKKENKTREVRINVALWRVRVAIVAVEKQ